MNYHCIAHASDETVRVFPQAHLVGGAGSEVSHIIEMLNKPRFPSLPGDLELSFKLDGRAIETDLLSSVSLAYGLLVSPKLLDILQQHNLPPHQIIKASVKTKGQEKPCHCVQFTKDLVSLVDFSKTKFTEYEPWTKSRKELTFKDDEERAAYVKTVKTLTTVNTTDLHLLQTEFDLLKIRYIFHGFLVSEKLMTALRAQGITGFTSIDYVRAVSP
jgi:hypothetical protein